MHELTEKIIPVSFGKCWSKEQMDKIIREWLEEKAKQLSGVMPYDYIQKILGISEKTLEEKFMAEYNKNHSISMPINDFILKLAQIAEEHYKNQSKLEFKS